MNNIFVDLSTLKEDEIKMACYGIKMFHHKKKNLSIVICGNKENMLTISTLPGGEIIDTSKKEENKDINSLLSDYFKNHPDIEESFSFVSFDKKNKVISLADKHFFKKKISPLIVAFYPNAYTGKMTLIGDLGYLQYPSKEDYLSYKNTMKMISKLIKDTEEPEVKLLVPSKLVISPLMKDVSKAFEEDKNYKGIIGTSELLKADCDVLIGDPSIIQATISGIDQGVSIYDEYLSHGMNTSFQYKFGGFFVKKLMQSFSSSIDKKLTSGGMLLLGYQYNVVMIRNDTTSNGVKACLELAYLANDKKLASSI